MVSLNNAYAVNIPSGNTVNITGTTVNNSDYTIDGTLNFRNTSSDGNKTLTNNNGGIINFYDSSSSGSGTISNGGLTAFNNTSTASTSTITNNAGATLKFNDNAQANLTTITNNGNLDLTGYASNNNGLFIGLLNSSGTINMGGNQLTIGLTNNNNNSISGVITGAGDIYKRGTGALNFGATYNGELNLLDGTLNVTNGGNISFLRSASQTTTNYTGTADASTTSIQNSGTLNFSGLTNNSFSIGSLFNSGPFNAGNKAVTVGSLNQVDRNTGSFTAGSLTKIGTGTFSMNTAFAGPTTVNGGTFSIFNTNLSNLTVGTAGLVNYTGASSASNGTITNSGILNFIDTSTASTSTITNNTGATLTFNISSTAGSSTITNAGILEFRNASTAATSTITNNSGATLNFNDTSTANNATLINAGTLNITGLNSGISIGSLNSTGTFNGTGKALTLGNLNGTDTIAGTFSAGSLTKIGTGTLNMNTAYTGPTTVSNGVLNINNASLGNLTVAASGTANYTGTASASSSAITNNGILSFAGTSSAATSTIANNSGAALSFSGTATAANASITNTGTLNLTGLTSGISIGSLNSTGTINGAGKALTIGNSNATNSIAGTFAAGSLTKIGTGILNMNTAYTGPTTVNAGTFNINSVTLSNLTIGASGTANYNGNATAPNGAIINNGNLIFKTSSNSLTSTITNNAGATLKFNDNANADLTTIINDGILDLSGLASNTNGLFIGNLNSSGTINMGGNQLTIGLTNNNNSSVSGTITGAGDIYKRGSGVLNFGAAYDGDLTLADGTLNMTNGGYTKFLAIGSQATANYTGTADASTSIIQSSGTLNFSGLTNNSFSIGSLVNSGTFNAASKSVTLGSLNQVDSITGPFTAGSLTKIGTGTLNMNIAFAGPTTVNGGTFNINSVNLGNLTVGASGTTNYYGTASALNNTIINSGVLNFYNSTTAATSTITNNTGATLKFINNSTANNAIITNAGTLNLTGLTSGISIGSLNSTGTINGSGKALTLGNLNGTNTIAGTFSAGSLTKIGTGTLNMNTAYTGPTTVSNGVLNINNASLGNLTVAASGTANYTGTASASSSAITNNGILSFASTSSAATSTIANNSGAALSFSGTATAANASITNTGTLNLTGLTSGISIGSLNSTGTINGAGKALTIGNSNGTSNLAGTFSVGSLNKVGAGVLNLNTTYNGVTVVNAGTFNVNNVSLGNLTVASGGTINYNGTASASSSTIANSGNLNFNNSATANNAIITNTGTLNLTGLANGLSMGSLNSTGTLNGGNQTLTIGNLNLTDNISGAFTGGALTKIGTGTLSIALPVSTVYNGLITVNSGTLDVNSGGIGNLVIASGAIANYNNNSTASIGGTVTNNGTLNFNDASSTSLSTITTNNGAITSFYGDSSAIAALITNSGGLVDVSNISDSNIIAGSIEGAGNYYLGDKTFTVGTNSLNTTVSGVISNANGVLAKVGTGTLILSGANTYTGGTDVQAGTLQIDGSIMSPVIVQSSGILAGSGLVDGNVANNGLMRPGTAATLGNFTINGNYTGNNGNLAIRLDGLNNDKLIINGTAGGTTYITLSGMGTPIPPDGIQLVATNGSTNDAFVLSTPTIGAYTYTLTYNGITNPNDNDWYIGSIMRQDFDVYGAVTPLAQEYGVTMIGSMHDRMAENFANGQLKRGMSQVWVRTIGAKGRRSVDSPNSGANYNFNMIGLQVGEDFLLKLPSGNGSYNIGYYGAIGESKGDIKSATGADKSINEIDAYSIGIHATYFTNSKIYGDILIQGTKYHAPSRTYLGDSIDPTGYGVAISGEAGYPIGLTANTLIEPQVQVVYQNIKFKKTRNSVSTLSFSGGDSLRIKTGGRFAYDFNYFDKGQNLNRRNNINFEVNLGVWHELKNKSVTSIGDTNNQGAVKFTTNNINQWYYGGLGVSGSITDNTRLYVDGEYQATQNRKSHVATGRIGLKINL